MTIERLENILEAKEPQRSLLIKDFQKEIWDLTEASDAGYEVLSELAYDLDFYEPDENIRKESASLFGEARLKTEILSAIQKLRVTTHRERAG